MEREVNNVKTRRTVIICASVVAALLTGILLMVLIPERSGEIEPVITPPPQEQLSMYEVDLENLVAVNFKPGDNPDFTIRIDKDIEEFVLEADKLIFPGNAYELQYVVFSAISLSNLTRVTENADDNQLTLFGLDTPRVVWQLEYLNGTTHELALGAELPAGEGSYVRSLNSRAVYIVGQVQASFLSKPLEELYNILFLPIPPSTEEEPTWDYITHVIMERPDQEILEFRRRNLEELSDSPVGTSTFKLVQPFETDCSTFMIQSLFLEAITYAVPQSVETVHPNDLSLYGLDNPVRLTVTIPMEMARDDFVRTLLIGRYDSERNGMYVMIEGHDAVLFAPRFNIGNNSNFDFMDVDPYQLRSRMIWLHNIADVLSVDFELDGVSRVLNLDDNGEFKGTLDDMELSDDNARRLYTSALNIIASGSTEEAIPDIPPQYSITINLKDGTSETVELYAITDSEYLIVHEGISTENYITRLALHQNLLNRFDILDAGGDLGRM